MKGDDKFMYALLSGNKFGKRTMTKVLAEYFNSDRKLADIIEEMCPNISPASRNYLMDMCESAIPLMIKLEYLNKE